jgi:hypothetical protein
MVATIYSIYVQYIAIHRHFWRRIEGCEDARVLPVPGQIIQSIFYSLYGYDND